MGTSLCPGWIWLETPNQQILSICCMASQGGSPETMAVSNMVFRTPGMHPMFCPTWGHPLTISFEQHLMLSLTSGNKKHILSTGEISVLPSLCFLQLVQRDSHTQTARVVGKTQISCTAPQSVLRQQCQQIQFITQDCSHTAHHNNLVPQLCFAWKEQATLNSIRNHSNKWEDSNSPGSPLGNDHSSS